MKKFILFLSFVGLLFGCSEEIEEQEENLKAPRVKESTIRNLYNKDNRFKQVAEKTGFNPALQRDSTITLYGKEVYNDRVKIIENDTVISYTMLIKKDSLLQSYFDNLVIQHNKITNEDVVTAFRYLNQYTEDAPDNSFRYFGPIQRNGGVQFEIGQGYIDILMCNYGGSEHVAGSGCTRTYIKRFYLTLSGNDSVGGSTSSGGGTGPGTGGSTGGPGTGGATGPGTGGSPGSPGGGGSSPGNGSPIYSQPQDPEDNEEPVITSPVKSLDDNEEEEEEQEKTPCQKVKDVFNNKPEVKNKTQALQNPSYLNLNYEKGFQFNDNESPINVDGAPGTTGITFQLNDQGTVFAIVHVHFDRPDMSPCFTVEDLQALNGIYQWRASVNKPIEDVILIVITRAGTFSMVVENPLRFAQANNLQDAALKEDLFDKFNNTILDIDNPTDEKVIAMVAKNLAIYGVGLFKANEDLSGWSKINPVINEEEISFTLTPCN